MLAQSDINITIGDMPLETYFTDFPNNVKAGRRNTAITDRAELCANLRMSCLPESLLSGVIPDYDEFLEQRCKLMALKIKAWFDTL